MYESRLMELADQYPNMTVAIKVSDLIQANRELARSVREEVETEVAERTAEIGERLIPKAEARVMLGNPDDSTLYRWAERGYLTRVKIGNKIYYTAASLRKIIHNHTL
jgi:hypothetical protein